MKRKQVAYEWEEPQPPPLSPQRDASEQDEPPNVVENGRSSMEQLKEWQNNLQRFLAAEASIPTMFATQQPQFRQHQESHLQLPSRFPVASSFEPATPNLVPSISNSISSHLSDAVRILQHDLAQQLQDQQQQLNLEAHQRRVIDILQQDKLSPEQIGNLVDFLSAEKKLQQQQSLPAPQPQPISDFDPAIFSAIQQPQLQQQQAPFSANLFANLPPPSFDPNQSQERQYKDEFIAHIQAEANKYNLQLQQLCVTLELTRPTSAQHIMMEECKFQLALLREQLELYFRFENEFRGSFQELVRALGVLKTEQETRASLFRNQQHEAILANSWSEKPTNNLNITNSAIRESETLHRDYAADEIPRDPHVLQSLNNNDANRNSYKAHRPANKIFKTTNDSNHREPVTAFAWKVSNLPKTISRNALRDLVRAYHPVKVEVAPVKVGKGHLKPKDTLEENGGWGVIWFGNEGDKTLAKTGMTTLFASIYPDLTITAVSAGDLRQLPIPQSRLVVAETPRSLYYVCDRCGVKGHLIGDCPTKGNKNFNGKRFARKSFAGIPVSARGADGLPNLTGKFSPLLPPPPLNNNNSHSANSRPLIPPPLHANPNNNIHHASSSVPDSNLQRIPWDEHAQILPPANRATYVANSTTNGTNTSLSTDGTLSIIWKPSITLTTNSDPRDIVEID